MMTNRARTLDVITLNFAENPPANFANTTGNTPPMVLRFSMMMTGWTAFTTSFLKSFDAELLIGQLSYNQKANIYNAIYGYNRGLKKTSSSEKGKEDHVHQTDSEETFSGKDNR